MRGFEGVGLQRGVMGPWTEVCMVVVYILLPVSF